MKTMIQSANPENVLGRYMEEISRTPLLTRREENRLAKLILEQNDSEALARLIESNLRLVVKIAHDFTNRGLALEDLVAEGNIGLTKAAQRFDPTKGAKFSTYAAWWIRQAIQRALATQSKTIRLPVHAIEKVGKIRRSESELRVKLGREATDGEVSLHLGLDRRKVAHLRAVAQCPGSLDEPVGDEGGRLVAETIGDEAAISPLEALSAKDMAEKLAELLGNLSERERKILDARFGLAGQSPMTLSEVGKQFGITRERIRQLQNSALEKLRQALQERETPPSEFCTAIPA